MNRTPLPDEPPLATSLHQAVAVPTPGPGREAGGCLAFAQAGQDQEGRLSGFSFRHSEPVEIRWRMMPAARFRV